jgi:hypothetical protein
VQVTRDGHPVIHHDVAVDLGGVRIPVVSLTLQEFLVIREANHSTQQQHVSSVPTDETSSRHRNRSLSPRSRGKSDEGILFARFDQNCICGAFPAAADVRIRSAMAITDKFPSLEEVCKCVPESTGFDVEIKFPTPIEEQSYCVKVPCVKITERVSRPFTQWSGRPQLLLRQVYRRVRSFFCFLTESAGPIKTPDPRRASLHHAIEWARAIHCWGIVTECWPVVHAPELVQMVCGLLSKAQMVARCH